MAQQWPKHYDDMTEMLGGGARREAGHEEGELELEDGQALGGGPDAGGHELLDPDSLTHIAD
uniref:Uncharacterized protein n=1 Tax=Aegilops tauschii TaxID=37682 RepID=M8CJR6_AEGTA